MDKRARERVQAMASYAHGLGGEMGRCHGDWSREAIEKVAPDMMGIRARWYAWSNDPLMVALFTLNFANGWQFANAPGETYKGAPYNEPTIHLPQDQPTVL
jgi:hypothetical protein